MNELKRLMHHRKGESFPQVVNEDIHILTGVSTRQKNCILGITGIDKGKDFCLPFPKRRK